MKYAKMTIAGIIVALVVSQSALAGPYSPGKGGPAEAGFIDAGIAGFVGPAGEGVRATTTNGNYVNPVFKGWAAGIATYDPSDELGLYGMNSIGRPPDYSMDFGDPQKATGEVTGDNMDIVSLGDMDATEIASHLADPAANPLGTLVLTFDHAICNGAGADFATFENGFISNYNTNGGSVQGQMFAELGYVEVSTDGVNFARFSSTYLNTAPSGSQAYLAQDVSNIHNLAGKHANAYGISWGTPFDLNDLTDDPMVTSNVVNLDEINYVKIVDIPGDGTFQDGHQHGIYDAWVTWGSGGMDFEALGVINQTPEPATICLLLTGAAVGLWRKERNIF